MDFDGAAGGDFVRGLLRRPRRVQPGSTEERRPRNLAACGCTRAALEPPDARANQEADGDGGENR